MTLDFKRITENDIDLLVDISRTTFISAFEQDNNPEDFTSYVDSAFHKNTLLAELSNLNSTFYFVYYTTNLVGYIKLNENDAQNEQFDSPSLELERIYVYDQYQGQRIGKHIIDKVIALAKQKQYDFLWLGVWEENKQAIRFYQNNGFVKFGTHPYYIGKDKQTDWLMKLNLV